MITILREMWSLYKYNKELRKEEKERIVGNDPVTEFRYKVVKAEDVSTTNESNKDSVS